MTAGKPDDALTNDDATADREVIPSTPEWYPYRDWSVIPDPLVYEQETREAAEARVRELEAEIARLRGGH